MVVNVGDPLHERHDLRLAAGRLALRRISRCHLRGQGPLASRGFRSPRPPWLEGAREVRGGGAPGGVRAALRVSGGAWRVRAGAWEVRGEASAVVRFLCWLCLSGSALIDVAL